MVGEPACGEEHEGVRIVVHEPVNGVGEEVVGVVLGRAPAVREDARARCREGEGGKEGECVGIDSVQREGACW